MAGIKKIATLGCAGVGALAFIFGLYHFISAILQVLEKSRITSEGAHNAPGNLENGVAISQASDSPLHLFLNKDFEDSGLSCDDVFDSMTAQLDPLSYRWPPFNETETPYSASDFNGVAPDGNAKGAFTKVCAKDPSTNFYSDLILLAKADYATCKTDCDWTFCRFSTLAAELVWNCDFQYTIQASYKFSGTAGANIEQTKKTWENLWIAMDCVEGHHVFCGDQDKAATAHWASARTPLYAGLALLLVAVLLHCFMPADAEQGEPAVELMS